VVFNFPAGDTVALERLNETYYDIVRSYVDSYGEKRGRELLRKQYTILSRPVDKREHYVKRCVAVAGDTLEIVGSQLYVNGEPQNFSTEQQYIYFVQTTSHIGQRVFDRLGISKDDIHYSASSGIYAMPLTNSSVEALKALSNVVSVTKNEATETYSAIFPNNVKFGWTEDNFGPLWVPSKGATVALSIENLPLYERIIKNYEGNELEVTDGVIYICDVVYSREPMEVTEREVAEMLCRNRTRTAAIESNNGGRGFARAVQRLAPTTRVEWFHQSGNKEARILSHSATALHLLRFPRGWQQRWRELYSHLTTYRRIFHSNRWHDAADVITGIVERETSNSFRAKVSFIR
jgi:predicted phage terminase large subunit-like protein